MWKQGTLAERRSPARQQARAARRDRRASGRSNPRSERRGVVSFGFNLANHSDGIDETEIRAKVERELAKRKGIGIREQLSLRTRLRDFFLNVQRAAGIQRCGFIPAVPKGVRRSNPNPAPCGGRLYRSGGLLTCRLCGRIAKG